MRAEMAAISGSGKRLQLGQLYAQTAEGPPGPPTVAHNCMPKLSID